MKDHTVKTTGTLYERVGGTLAITRPGGVSFVMRKGPTDKTWEVVFRHPISNSGPHLGTIVIHKGEGPPTALRALRGTIPELDNLRAVAELHRPDEDRPTVH